MFNIKYRMSKYIVKEKLICYYENKLYNLLEKEKYMEENNGQIKIKLTTVIVLILLVVIISVGVLLVIFNKNNQSKSNQIEERNVIQSGNQPTDIKRDYISDEQKNKTAFLTATAIKNQIKAKITNNKNQSSVVDGKNISGDLNIWSYVDCYDVDDNIFPKNSTINYMFDDVNSSYEFAPTMPGQEYDVQMLYQNCGYSIEAESLVNAKFVPEKSVDVKSGGGKISAGMTLNKGYYGLPWYTITASSNNAKAIGLTKNENGIIVNSDNFSNLVVTGENDDETKQITLNTESNSVLITEKDNSLVACVDNNNDGTYETVIASSDGDVSP